MSTNSITLKIRTDKEIQVKLDDIEKFTIKLLREQDCSNYGYDVYLPNVIKRYISDELKITDSTNSGIHSEEILRQLSPLFYNATWGLCVRGILRPGITMHGSQATEDGSSGNGYSFTPFGEKWLSESDKDDYIPTAPDRFEEMIAPYKDLLGEGFYQRASEAIRCYGAHCYLACCSMTGAAVESIVLKLAIEREGDEDRVMDMYKRKNGRSMIENLLTRGKSSYIRNQYSGFSGLLKYWRDQSSHGMYTEINSTEAFTSLAILLRFCAFVEEQYSELISN
jgi:hypothetical protein